MTRGFDGLVQRLERAWHRCACLMTRAVRLTRILTRSKDELSSDALSMHGFERLSAKDYRLAYLPGRHAGRARGRERLREKRERKERSTQTYLAGWQPAAAGVPCCRAPDT